MITNNRKNTIRVYKAFLLVSVLTNIALWSFVTSWGPFCARPIVFQVGSADSLTCPWKLLYARPAPGGHFGKRFMEYASVWAVAKRYNLTAVIADNISSALGPSFARMSIPSKSAYVKDLHKENPICSYIVDGYLRDAPAAKVSKDIEGLIREQYRTMSPVSIRSSAMLEDFIPLVRESFRRDMKMHPALASYAQKMITKISQDFGKNPSEIVFVGIHVRAMDYRKYIKLRFGAKARYAGVETYFMHATNHMIESLHAPNIAFLVVSDDESYCTTELIPALKQHLSDKCSGMGSFMVRWCGSNSYRHDFAVLSSCNHSVITYGSYGIGAAVLAGGITVVYDVNAGGSGIPSGAMRFASNIPEWSIMY